MLVMKRLPLSTGWGLLRVQYGRYEQGKDLRFNSLVKVISALEMTLDESFGEVGP